MKVTGSDPLHTSARAQMAALAPVRDSDALSLAQVADLADLDREGCGRDLPVSLRNFSGSESPRCGRHSRH